jgi:hypothetical protein
VAMVTLPPRCVRGTRRSPTRHDLGEPSPASARSPPEPEAAGRRCD